MTKILMLLQSEFPPDIRVEKEAKSLNERGYDITLLCNDYGQRENRDVPYLKIERLEAPFKKIIANKIFNFPLFFNPRFIARAISLYLRNKPEIIHSHDLPMVPLAILLKKVFGVPVIFDMHENYPEALKEFDKKGVVNFLFKNYKAAALLEKYCIKHSDKIIVVVEENKKRLIERGVPPKKIAVVSNTVDLNTFNSYSSDIKIPGKYSGKKIIMYTGTISPERGLDTPVRSLKYLKAQVPDIKMVFIGKGPSVEELKLLAEKEGVNDLIDFIPWIDHKELKAYLACADICMIPQPNNEFINTTIPHKLFEYMSQGKPVLVSDAEPLKRIIMETGAGGYFISGNAESFASEAATILKEGKEYGTKGINAINKKYNWDNEVKVLETVYEEILK